MGEGTSRFALHGLPPARQGSRPANHSAPEHGRAERRAGCSGATVNTGTIQPMTALDSARAEGFAQGRVHGRREGILMAATALGNTASTVAGHGAASDTVADSLAFVAGMLRDLAGRL